MDRLKNQLSEIHKKSYRAYKQLKGDYHFPGFIFRIDHVQGDPFADPSRCRLLIKTSTKDLPESLYNNTTRKRALEDYIGRQFFKAIKSRVKGNRGSGKSGEISIVNYGQEVLKRNAVLVTKECVEVRVRIGLPANLRNIDTKQAQVMCLSELPSVVAMATDAFLKNGSEDPPQLTDHIFSVENQCFLRTQLTENKLVSFIADGSILPRKSGVDETPLLNSVIFKTPKSLAVELKQANGKMIRGMGIPKGVTLIVGGGFHGKSTLLHALERGVYDYIPGDGRERVVTIANACKIRAEDRRAITGVNISPFVDNLPQGKDTHNFSTQDASGSTSQASNIMEALETQTKLLLIDEDTSATNFMIRDQRMQALVAKEKEPITPLVSRVHVMEKQNGVSTIIVMGGSGDYFAVADNVIMMDNYVAKDVTKEAKALADNTPLKQQNLPLIRASTPRVIDISCLNPRGNGTSNTTKEKIQAFDTRRLRYGSGEVDVSKVEQLADNAQLLAIGFLIRYYHERISEMLVSEGLVDDLRQLLKEVEQQGLDSITPYITGTLAMPRIQELAATINRMRSLKLK